MKRGCKFSFIERNIEEMKKTIRLLLTAALIIGLFPFPKDVQAYVQNIPMVKTSTLLSLKLVIIYDCGAVIIFLKKTESI